MQSWECRIAAKRQGDKNLPGTQEPAGRRPRSACLSTPTDVERSVAEAKRRLSPSMEP